MIEAKKIQQLDFNLLKVFECIYQQRNMSLAAKILFISPSAVSHALKRLRSVLGDELFVRQGQLMLPTPACQRMAPQLLDTIERLRQILQACGEFDLSKTSQTFKLATHEALEPIIIPKIQQLIQKQVPNAKLTSVKIERNDMARQLTTSQIDAAIDVALPLKKPVKHFNLSSDQFCVLMHRGHALVNQLNAENYLSSQHITVSNRATGSVVEDIAFLQQGINRDLQLRCQSYQTAKEVIKGSQYLLTLPSIVAQLLLDDELVIAPLPYQLPPIATHLYWHLNTDMDEAQLWLRDAIKQVFSSTLPKLSRLN